MKYHNNEDPEQAGELLYSILDGSTEYAIIATDLNDIIILWNKGAELIYGFTSDDMVGKRTITDLHKKDSIDSDILFFTENTFRSSIFDHAMTAVRKDGSVLPVSVTVTSRTNELNEIIGFLIVVRDITKNKLQDQFRDVLIEVAYVISSPASIDNMCRSAINSISRFLDIPAIFICILDKQNSFRINSQIGLCEECCSHCCAYTPENEDAIPENMKDCFLTYSQFTINSGKLPDNIISGYIVNKDIVEPDTAIVHVPLISDVALIGILHIILPTSRKGFLITETQVLSLIANEISAGIQRKRLEEEIKQYADNLEKMVNERTDQLREKDAQLVQSGKLATLGEMAMGIAHEINQPLGGISLMVQGLLMAKERGKLSETLLSNKLSSVIEQIDRIDKIIKNLRTFARQPAEGRQEVNINNPITDVFKLIGEQLKNRSISVEHELAEDLPSILADHNKLEQVFLNIVGNARDALDDFEETVNKLKEDAPAPEWVESWYKKIIIKSYKKDDYVLIEIIDNAGGIPQSIIQKIFEPFFTTKEVGKGTGLGLSITYGIVKEFGGSIEAKSEEMKGSKFILKFPVYKGAKK